MVWTLEEKQKIAAWWNEGESAGQISLRIGISRSAVIGLVHRNCDLFNKKKHGAGGGRRPKERAESRADEGLRRRLVNRGRDAEKRAAAIETVKAVRAGTAVDAKAYQPVFEADPSGGTLRDLSRFQVAGAKPIAFVDLGAGQCRFPLSAFADIAGPYTPCCGASTGDPLASWCGAHQTIVCARAA